MYTKQSEASSEGIDMESNNMKFPDDPSVTLTIRLIMQGKVSRDSSLFAFPYRFFHCRLHFFSVNARTIESRFFTRSNKSSCKSFIFMIFHREFTFCIRRFSLLNDASHICKSQSSEALECWFDVRERDGAIDRDLLKVPIAKALKINREQSSRLLMNSNNGVNISVPFYLISSFLSPCFCFDCDAPARWLGRIVKSTIEVIRLLATTPSD